MTSAMEFDELLQHRQTTCLRSSRWPSIINVNSSNGGVSSICVAAAIYTLKIHSKFPVYFFPPLCCAAKWGRMAFKSPVSRWAKWTKWKWFWMHYFFFPTSFYVLCETECHYICGVHECCVSFITRAVNHRPGARSSIICFLCFASSAVTEF